ncbi:MAG: dynamin family protein, partial [Armatimonadetes bacterium]|nr:dynamin family protein [Armatimonadota bacterium]
MLEDNMNIIPPWTELEGSFVLDNPLNHDAIQTASTHTDSTRNQTGQLAHLIERAEQVLDAAGASYTSFREKLSILKKRLEEERFHLAVLGQFKRGKSTLLNALLGDEVLPTSVLPLTSIPTFIEYGPEFKAKVILQSGADIDLFANESPSQLADFLAEYVTEEFNPGNRRGVLEVKVEHPSPLLRRGVVLIDTPGIGSTFRHNTEATLNFLPQCDASLFVVSPDPPITEVEIDFLRQVLAKTTHTIFVLNKIDYLADDELSKAVTFLKKVLKEHVGIGEAVRIFCVSARAGLRARQSGDEAGWVKSGMQAVQEHLIDFLANQKSSALRQAISRKVLAVISDAMLQIGISLESLCMPVDQLEERMRLLKSKLDEVEMQRMAQLDVLEGDRKRMIALLEEQASALRKKARSRLVEIVRQAAYEHIVPNEEEISEKLAETVPILFE